MTQEQAMQEARQRSASIARKMAEDEHKAILADFEDTLRQVASLDVSVGHSWKCAKEEGMGSDDALSQITGGRPHGWRVQSGEH